MEVELDRELLGVVDIDEAIRDRMDKSSHIIITIHKNKTMIKHFRKCGFVLMPSGYGSIEYHLRSRHRVHFTIDQLSEVVPGDNVLSVPRPYPALICSNYILEITVVTPGDYRLNSFSDWAVKCAINACLGV